MMSYLSVEWRKTKKFSMLMIGILWLQKVKKCLFYGDN